MCAIRGEPIHKKIRSSLSTRCQCEEMASRRTICHVDATTRDDEDSTRAYIVADCLHDERASLQHGHSSFEIAWNSNRSSSSSALFLSNRLTVLPWPITLADSCSRPAQASVLLSLNQRQADFDHQLDYGPWPMRQATGTISISRSPAILLIVVSCRSGLLVTLGLLVAQFSLPRLVCTARFKQKEAPQASIRSFPETKWRKLTWQKDAGTQCCSRSAYRRQLTSPTTAAPRERAQFMCNDGIELVLQNASLLKADSDLHRGHNPPSPLRHASSWFRLPSTMCRVPLRILQTMHSHVSTPPRTSMTAT